MKKNFAVLTVLLVFLAASSSPVYAQITTGDRKKLALKEDSLAMYARFFVMDKQPENRMFADSFFTRTLVRALQIKNSFYYTFDSVIGVSKLYAPDTSFRIITWNLQFDEYYSRQKGAIQMRTPDGSLKLFPLRDFSEFTNSADDSVRGPDNWIGAIYYNMFKTRYNNRNYYTLFGFDNNSASTSKKWVEVMYFNEKNQPVFGGPFFSFEEDSIRQKPKYRLSLEFKKDTRVLMNYIEELQLILVDHLISETDQPELASTLVPDGDSEGFRWEKGKWIHIDKVFNFKLQDGQAPIGDPLLDNRGKVNEQKLQDKSDKNSKPKKDQE